MQTISRADMGVVQRTIKSWSTMYAYGKDGFFQPDDTGRTIVFEIKDMACRSMLGFSAIKYYFEEIVNQSDEEFMRLLDVEVMDDDMLRKYKTAKAKKWRYDCLLLHRPNSTYDDYDVISTYKLMDVSVLVKGTLKDGNGEPVPYVGIKEVVERFRRADPVYKKLFVLGCQQAMEMLGDKTSCEFQFNKDTDQIVGAMERSARDPTSRGVAIVEEDTQNNSNSDFGMQPQTRQTRQTRQTLQTPPTRQTRPTLQTPPTRQTRPTLQTRQTRNTRGPVKKRNYAMVFLMYPKTDSIVDIERRIIESHPDVTELVHGDMLVDSWYSGGKGKIVCVTGKTRMLIDLKWHDNIQQAFAIPLEVTKLLANPQTYFSKIWGDSDVIDGFELDKNSKYIRNIFKQPSELLSKAKFYLSLGYGLIVKCNGKTKKYTVPMQNTIETDFAVTKTRRSKNNGNAKEWSVQRGIQNGRSP